MKTPLWILFTLARIGCAVMLIWALWRHPFGYFQLLRIVVIGVCALGIYCALEWNNRVWIPIFASLILLFNPLMPIALGRQWWNHVDIAVAALLTLSIFLMRANQADSPPKHNLVDSAL
jgi:hypothetical protein